MMTKGTNSCSMDTAFDDVLHPGTGDWAVARPTHGQFHIKIGKTVWIICFITWEMLLSCQPIVTVTSCFVYKVIRDLESIDHLFIILSAG